MCVCVLGGGGGCFSGFAQGAEGFGLDVLPTSLQAAAAFKVYAVMSAHFRRRDIL